MSIVIAEWFNVGNGQRGIRLGSVENHGNCALEEEGLVEVAVAVMVAVVVR
jgi:hypothetical protein